jgi:hypothetical protein
LKILQRRNRAQLKILLVEEQGKGSLLAIELEKIILKKDSHARMNFYSLLSDRVINMYLLLSFERNK